MKRRVLSLITALALCVSLCPVQVLAADGEAGGPPCTHHPEHTEECGYVPPTPGAECTHSHDDGCYTIETDCIHEHTAECYGNPDYDPETDQPDACTHICTEDSGCVTRTLSCTHEHDEACGYAAEDPGVPCGFVCKICPINSLMEKLPDSVSADNLEQIGAQLSEIYDLYDELTADEQELVDLEPCLSLQNQMDEISAETLAAVRDPSKATSEVFMESDEDYPSPLTISESTVYNTNGHTVSSAASSVLQVAGTGELHLTGKIVSQNGSGVKVLPGGYLGVLGEGSIITGATYGLDISASAEVALSAGTFTGETAAIHAEGDFAALLAPGCSFFDESGAPLLPGAAAGEKTLVVGPCANHPGKAYEPADGKTEHTWTCQYCAAQGTEMCTFPFDETGTGTCVCGHRLTITVDSSTLGDLIYDGTAQTANVSLTVALEDGTVLAKDTDYTVAYSTRTDVGEVTVTVTGKTFNGTFTKAYSVGKDTPVITWSETTKELGYDGRLTTIEDQLPSITITLKPDNKEDLHPFIQYSYRKVGDTEFTDGLPLDAGAYEVRARIPESQNYAEAVTNPPLRLTIQKINPVETPPAAANLTYHRGAQELVTPGAIDPRAVGAEILYATSADGSYSTEIPTGTDAGGYTVWYQVKGTNNYNAVGPTEIKPVEIKRKPTTPVVTLSDYTYLYDGGFKEPRVTVKDEDGVTILLESEYNVAYEDNRNVGTAKVKVSDKSGGNYAIHDVTVDFQITARTQETLSITGKPDTIVYGQQFTLSTSGGSGSGDVTWEITDGGTVAKVDEKSGQITAISPGSATVKATKSGKNPADTDVVNYGDATASWTFHVGKRPVTATVTADDKTFDGDKIAVVHAVVEQGVLPGDAVTIGDLPGTFADENAGVDKTVTVDTSHPTISGKNSEHYDVSFSGTAVKATIHKAVAKITSVSDAKNLTYTGSPQNLIDGAAVVDPAGSVDVEYALSEDGPYSTASPQGTNAGTYTVWYRVKENGNYTGLPAASTEVTIAKKSVTPTVTLSGSGLQLDAATQFYVYDGAAKTPDVTLSEAGGARIPAEEYTVSYSGNVDAGAAKVTVTAKADGNYTFTKEENFTIRPAVAELTSSPQAKELEYTGQPQELVTVGTAKGGHVAYSLDNTSYGPGIPTGTDARTYTVYYKAVGTGNYKESTTVGSVSVTIRPKRVTPAVTLSLTSDPLAYTGSPLKPSVAVSVEGTALTAGTHYTVAYSNNINVGTATVTVESASGTNYQFRAQKTFEIAKSKAKFAVEPVGLTLAYTGGAQRLIQENTGTSTEGIVLYSLNAVTYSAEIPTGTDVGQYTIYTKVQGNSTHEDSEAKTVTAEIKTNSVANPTVTLPKTSFNYTGSELRPAVTVTDDKGNVIPSSEYTVSYSDNVEVGTAAKVTVTSKGSNYSFTKTVNFTIVPADQPTLSITGKPDAVYYGDTLYLDVTGGAGGGAVTWSVASGAATSAGGGRFEITGAGSVTITATKQAGGSYTEATDTWQFYARPKPISAVVTADDKPYDGNNTATLKVVFSGSDVVAGDDLSGVTAQGHFVDGNAGTNKTVIIDSFTIPADTDISAKYAIARPAATTASITPKTASVATPPEGVAGLTYTGQPQALVRPGGTAEGGELAYSLDGASYSLELPTGTEAKEYTVWYKVIASDGNYRDSAAVQMSSVTIGPCMTPPTVLCTPGTFRYDGTEKTPAVAVRVGGRAISESEYTVTFSPTPRIAAGTYTVTVTDNPGGNYQFDPPVTATFEITASSQNPLSIVTDIPTQIHYGDTFRLSATGGSGGGAIQWSVEQTGNVAAIDGNGVVTVNGVGDFTVKAYRKGADGYGDSNPDSLPFTAGPKPVTPVVTAKNKPYDGTRTAELTADWKPGDLVGTDQVTLTMGDGEFETAEVGANQTVTFQPGTASGDMGNYVITWPVSTTASIRKATPTIATDPAASAITADQPLSASQLSGGEAHGVSGAILPGTFAWAEEAAAPVSGNSYQVIFTPADTVHYNTQITSVAVTVNPADGTYSVSNEPGTTSVQAPATVEGGTASTVMSEADGSRIVQAAVENRSQNVVIKPEITGDVAKTEVSIPAATIGRLGSGTSAALTVSAPIADVTIPHEALGTLSAAGGTVSVTTERVDQTVVMTLAAGGSSVDSVPGGVTLTVPVEDAAPGTVAVLIRGDGTSEVIPKSVITGGRLSIPLDGSATVKIVDNSKSFDDVQSDNWAAGAIAFVSARELFHCDNESTFKPDEALSRGTLAAALYNLEGRPAQAAASTFRDVNSGDWYADGASWAVGNRIAEADENGHFGPDVSVTGEQLMVMLWRYAGRPEVGGGTDTETDTQKALHWATEKGITNGCGDGLDLSKAATRAQAAQMLKNFMENT